MTDAVAIQLMISITTLASVIISAVSQRLHTTDKANKITNKLEIQDSKLEDSKDKLNAITTAMMDGFSKVNKTEKPVRPIIHNELGDDK